MGQLSPFFFFFFFFNDTATTEIYTLSLHDALPISLWHKIPFQQHPLPLPILCRDRKSTRLNSSHQIISYAVFCLKKKKCCRLVPLELLTTECFQLSIDERLKE